jgi:replicative DNA helicase
MDRVDIEKIIQRVKSEKKETQAQLTSNEGLVKLQKVMSEYEGEDKLYTSEEIVLDLKDKPIPTGFKTGITALDELTGGFRKRQVITMFAHTKHGKTETAMWLMSLFPELTPVMIPLEQGADELISQRLERNYTIPHFVAPRRNDTFVLTEWIEERIVEGIAKYNSQMVVIDHLGYIDNMGVKGKWARENLAYRLGQVMKEIHHLAIKWDVVIILLAHISEGDEGKPPQLQDIGNSSDIKKESDTVISIWRKNSQRNKVRIYENKTMLSVLANRRFGKNGNVGLLFNPETGTFSEDNNWVKSMEDMAKAEVNAEEVF